MIRTVTFTVYAQEDDREIELQCGLPQRRRQSRYSSSEQAEAELESAIWAKTGVALTEAEFKEHVADNIDWEAEAFEHYVDSEDAYADAMYEAYRDREVG